MSAIASKTDTSREERCIYVRKALLPGPQRRSHIVLKSRWPRIEDDHQRRLDVADGLALDVAAGHIYWTNMGDPNRNDGSPCPLNAQDGCQPRGAPDGGF